VSRVYPEAGPEVGVVRSLLGRSQVAMALACLGSLLRRSAEPVRLVLHDDGTLDAEARARLLDGLDEAVIVTREEADDRLAPLLARMPAIRAYRETNPLGLKLVDVVLLGEERIVQYCDADILFVRTYRGLFGDLAATCDARFMSDYQCAYSLRSRDLLRDWSLRPAFRVNTGIVQVRRAAVDVDAVERSFVRSAAHRTPQWAEQTCWALIAEKLRTEVLAPEQIRFPFEDPPARAGTVALHFIGPLRDRLDRWLRLAEDAESSAQPEPVISRPVRRCTALDLAIGEVVRWRARRATP